MSFFTGAANRAWAGQAHAPRNPPDTRLTCGGRRRAVVAERDRHTGRRVSILPADYSRIAVESGQAGTARRSSARAASALCATGGIVRYPAAVSSEERRVGKEG